MPLVALPARAVCPAGTYYSGSGAPVLEPGETVALVVTGVGMVVGTIDCGGGAVYVTTDRLIWVCEAMDRPGAAVEFESIMMHAVSRDGSADATGRPALFCHMEADPAWESSLGGTGTEVSGVAKAAAAAASGDEPDDALAAGLESDGPSMDADAGHPAAVSVLFVPGPAATVLLEGMPPSLAAVASAGDASMFADADVSAGASSGTCGDEDILSKLFRFLSLCAAAHPGAADEADEAGDAVTGGAGGDEEAAVAVISAEATDTSGWITGDVGLSEEQAAALDSLHAKLDTSRFADAVENDDVDTE